MHIEDERKNFCNIIFFFNQSGGKENLPRLNGQTWTSNIYGNVTVKCISFPLVRSLVGGVNGRRGCSGQLSLYQGEILLEQIE